jgi:hypothetical protein
MKEKPIHGTSNLCLEVEGSEIQTKYAKEIVAVYCAQHTFLLGILLHNHNDQKHMLMFKILMNSVQLRVELEGPCRSQHLLNIYHWLQTTLNIL